MTWNKKQLAIWIKQNEKLEIAARDAEMRVRRHQGVQLKVLAYDYRLTIGRVSQICKEPR